MEPGCFIRSPFSNDCFQALREAIGTIAELMFPRGQHAVNRVLRNSKKQNHRDYPLVPFRPASFIFFGDRKAGVVSLLELLNSNPSGTSLSAKYLAIAC